MLYVRSHIEGIEGDPMLTDHLSSQESTALATPALDDPALYINRELSWLQFNWRVLDEALQPV